MSCEINAYVISNFKEILNCFFNYKFLSNF